VETAWISDHTANPSSRSWYPRSQTTRTGERAGNQAHGRCHYSPEELESVPLERIGAGKTTSREDELERTGARCSARVAAGHPKVDQPQG